MAHYIDAECLKAKLDEHYRKYQSKYMETRTPYTQGLIDALDLAEQVIDSLQQEQPSEICSKCIHHGKDDGYCYNPYGGMQSLVNENGVYECTGFCEQEQQEEPDESLEEAAEKSSTQYYKDAGYSPFPNVETAAHKSGFIAGAKWQKEQMMKDGNVILAEEDFDAEKEKSMEWGYNLCKEQMMKEAEPAEIGYFNQRGLSILTEKAIERMPVSEGDKVRVIVLKAEEE